MFTLMVANIPDVVQEPDLMQLFGGFGEVRRIMLFDARRPKFALIDMSRAEEALAAVKATHGQPLHQQALEVEAYFT